MRLSDQDKRVEMGFQKYVDFNDYWAFLKSLGLLKIVIFATIGHFRRSKTFEAKPDEIRN